MTFQKSGCTILDPDSQKKLMVSVGVSWSGKTCLFIDTQKTKVDQNCYIDLLKTS